MDISKYGPLKSKLLLRERKGIENMRRLVVSSSVLAVCFFLLWVWFLLRMPVVVPGMVAWFALIVYVTAQIAFGGYGYFWIKQKKKNECVGVIRFYWGLNYACLSIFVLLAASETDAMVYLGFLFLIFAILPLLESRELITVTVLEGLLGVICCVRGQIDLEHFCYIGIMGCLCAVISRQKFVNFLRRMEDGYRIDNAKNQAERDPMTGMLNRRGLERRVTGIWPTCVRQRMGIAIIMMDIDNFKGYNDTFGHPMGDKCIQAVTEQIKNSAPRKTDYVARVGGEEFLVLLTGITPSDALRWAKNCKEAIEALEIQQAPGNFLPMVSVSMGVEAEVPGIGDKFWEMRNEADRCLYQAKENGRACIFMKEHCYAKTNPPENRRQYYLERGFRSLG
ncbi:MAG: GGDEF domain-containing protein [Lachnospiraceae bacterium]